MGAVLRRRWLAGLCLSLVASLAWAAPADEKKGELKSLREQIRAVQDEIKRAEESRSEVADDLAAADKSISAAQRRLREIARKKQEAQIEIARLSQERQRIEAELSRLRKQLGDTIYRMYVERGEAGARRLLSGDDPNRIARDTYYLSQIARQRSQAVEDARLALANLQKVIEEAEQRREELEQLEREHASEQASLLDARNKQRAVLSEISGKLRSQRREVQSLQRDEARLARLIKGLEAIAREAARKRAEKEAQAARELAAQQSTPSTETRKPAIAQPERREPVTGRANSVADGSVGNADFGSLKGRLRWPVKGEIVGKFGASRAEGGTNWRGVFIRAASGMEVRAIAGGTIAYADWLRGFGNLVIVDHGDGYMSIYGNNEALFKSAGDAVKAGDVLSTVGASGGATESGLYFEIRRRGEPQDPLKWVVVK